ncbi:hypothetical protein [Cellulosimicrobium composti]|uniref:hypothetical protein n=1 Tax=Cellulosimicrobium composti TaxID=2672572 RepID=UPI000E244A2B
MSHPTEPYEPVDDQTVMRPPRRYGDPGTAPGATAPPGPPAPPSPAPAPYPPAYGTPHVQAPYGTDPYGPPRGGTAWGYDGGDPHATLPPAHTGATWPPAGATPGHAGAGPVHDAPADATVVPGALAPPADPYAFSPYAPPTGRGPRPWLVPTLVGVGAFVVVAGGLGVWLGLRDDAPPVDVTVTAEPDPATPAAPADPVDPDPAPSDTGGADAEDDDEPWLDAQYRAGAEMDPASGPDLAPMSWEFFSDNDYRVNGDRIALTARRDFACDDLPAIPAVESFADVCQGGFEARVVSHDGATVALDAVVVEVGSVEEADRVAAAYDAAADGDPAADTSGPAHPTLAAAVPQPGFEASYAVLDAGEGPGVLLSTGSVVLLLRLGIDDGIEREQLLPVAQAVGLVVTDHEVAQSFGEKPLAKTKAG